MATHDLSFDLFAANAHSIDRRRRQHAKATIRAIANRAGRRTVRQRLRAMLPRADWRGL